MIGRFDIKPFYGDGRVADLFVVCEHCGNTDDAYFTVTTPCTLDELLAAVGEHNANHHAGESF